MVFCFRRRFPINNRGRQSIPFYPLVCSQRRSGAPNSKSVAGDLCNHPQPNTHHSPVVLLEKTLANLCPNHVSEPPRQCLERVEEQHQKSPGSELSPIPPKPLVMVQFSLIQVD